MANEPNGLGLEEMEAPERSGPSQVVERTAADLEAVFDVPVRISVVLGRTRIPVANLLKMDVGTVVELGMVGRHVDRRRRIVPLRACRLNRRQHKRKGQSDCTHHQRLFARPGVNRK